MKKSLLDHVDNATSLAGLAIFFTLCSNGLSSQAPEPYSEILAWIILPLLFRAVGQDDFGTGIIDKTYDSVSLSLGQSWMVAGTLAVMELYKSEYNMPEYMPLLTPMLLAIQRRHESVPEPSTPTSSTIGSFTSFTDTVWGTTVIALSTALVLIDGDLYRLLRVVLVVTTAVFAYRIYYSRSVTYHGNLQSSQDPATSLHILAGKVVTSLALIEIVQALMNGIFHASVMSVISLSILKALSWYFLIRTMWHAPWCTFATIGTFSVVATHNPFTQSSDIQAFLYVLASLITLGQTIHMLPKHAKTGSILWIFFLLPATAYMTNIYSIMHAQHMTPPGLDLVEDLMEAAKTDFQRRVNSQSKTYQDAHAEYIRRYGVNPPDGFDAWYEYATSHHSLLVDDFDTIHTSVSPFWNVSGTEIFHTMNNLQAASDTELWHCEFTGNNATTRCAHPHRTSDRHIRLFLNTMLANVSTKLPDMRLLINHLDEPQVMLPDPSDSGTHDHYPGAYSLTDLSRKPIWDAVTKHCTFSSSDQADNIKLSGMNSTSGLVANRSLDMDICRHTEYRYMHGLLMRPASFYLVEGNAPILSVGALSTMGDILYPSPAYQDNEFRYDKQFDLEWTEKQNNLYWAGSTTGGFVSDDQWQNFHRQKFVKIAQTQERRKHDYPRAGSSILEQVRAFFRDKKLFDVAFTRVLQCERRYCRKERRFFNVRSWADKDQALRSRLVFDIDGNGISGRYYKLLASKSTPLKQTLFREWHDDRLVPWLHYVPISQSMEELPELVYYLTMTTEGQRRAKEIADQGRDWFDKAFRDVDVSIYLYRLLLELARLQDPNRQASI